MWPICVTNPNPLLWGEDADEFRPELWVKSAQRDSYDFMTFSQGPRKCLGEHYTRTAMAAVLLDLVGRFRFRLPKDNVDVIEDDEGRRVKFGIVVKADIYADVEEICG